MIPRVSAPTLYVIVGMKIIKALGLFAMALMIYHLRETDLAGAFKELLGRFRVDPERSTLRALAAWLGEVTRENILWVAAIIFGYGVVTLIEGVGLFLRLTWAAWLAMGESALFIPLEIYKLSQGFSYSIVIILVLNVVILCYLLRNRHRLFHHHLHQP